MDERFFCFAPVAWSCDGCCNPRCSGCGTGMMSLSVRGRQGRVDFKLNRWPVASFEVTGSKCSYRGSSVEA